MMDNIRFISKRTDFDERMKVLDQEALSLNNITQDFLRRADNDDLSDDQAIKLIDYMNSSDFFAELEAYHFYLYDPLNISKWNDVLCHIYSRSISPIQMMN